MKAYVIGGGPGVDGWDHDDLGVVIACHDHAHRIARPPMYQVCADWVYWRDNEPREGSLGVWFDHGDAPSGFVGNHTLGVYSLPLWRIEWRKDAAMVGGCSGIPAMWWAWRLGAEEIELVGFTDQGRSAVPFRWAVQQLRLHGVEVLGYPLRD